jgi:hypothetical protein
MQRLLVWTASLTIVLCISMLSARLIGSRNKVPGAAIFDPGDCSQPCWHGIQPGKTTLDEAEAILRADPLFSDIRREQPVVRFDLEWTINSNPIYGGGVRAENNVVTKIWIMSYWLHDGVPLTDAMLALGSPQSISVCSGPSGRHATMIFSEKVTVNTELRSTDISLAYLPIVQAAHYPADSDLDVYPASAWRGFGTWLVKIPDC